MKLSTELSLSVSLFMKRFKFNWILAAGLVTIAATPAFASATLEVVQSVPLETEAKIAVPGLRLAQAVWLEMIQNSRQTIDLEQFYVSDQAGEALEPVIREIRKASDRGVRVRLLADSKFAKTYPDSLAQIGAFVNAETRLIDFSSYGGGIQHAKFFIVDGQQVFVGSHNFDWRALDHIHEIGLRVTDSQISHDLSTVFERDWAEGRRLGAPPAANLPATAQLSPPNSQTVPAGAKPTIRLVASPPAANPTGISDSLSGILELIQSAQKSIVVQTMEYTTKASGSGGRWLDLDAALRAAAKRGVQVQLVVDIGHVANARTELKALDALPNVEVRAVTIPAWSGGKIDYARLVHSKYMVIDGGVSAWVGTENWSKGYFMNSRDVGFIVTDASVGNQLAQVFAKVWSSPYCSAP